MRAITIMYDSLNRNYLPSYGGDAAELPNFKRLQDKAVTFDCFYAGSLPCIPARRELHTGRYNFLHRSWGPLEPFDDSVPEILGRNGIYSHCVSDHAHYWQEGGSTYHTKFSTCEMIRGQEGDFWKGEVKGFESNLDLHRQDEVNRKYMQQENLHPHYRTYQAGMEFLEKNYTDDNWYLHLEYFDPHEPYFVPEDYKQSLNKNSDWPNYGEVEEGSLQIEAFKDHYCSLLRMLDKYLGKVLDFMDKHDMWKDTMLIVNTDHGYLLGEHGYFGKNYMPNYEQIVRIPFFLWNPQVNCAGERRNQLTQTIDIAPTLLDCFGIDKPEQMMGQSLLPVVAKHEKIHEYILFGYFGKHVNITDGHYVYMRSGRVEHQHKLYNYTVLPLHMFTPFSMEELKDSELTTCDAFGFTKGTPLLKIPASGETSPANTCYMYEKHVEYGDLLFDLMQDDLQETPIMNEEVEKKMLREMRELLSANEAPIEQYERLGL